MTDELLRVEHVTKNYGKNTANRDISFAVNAGETAVLLGPNGAGKSTIIKCIAGLLRFKGDIFIAGEPNKSLAAKRRLGYIPEMPAVYELLTGRSTSSSSAGPGAWTTTATATRCSSGWSSPTSAASWAASSPRACSRKLSIACAMVHRPDVLIFDEPLVGLDPHAIKELKAIFRELRAEGRAVLISRI